MNNIHQLDMQYIWHPCSQMKDYESFKPLVIKRAQGSYIELSDGSKIIDAISSWWCKSLGHNHPALQKAMIKQMHEFEHVTLANTTNETIVELSQKLVQLHPGMGKVFYASDGSSAVEIALKMSSHARKNLGQATRTKYLALENSYHGETLGALSVSDIGIYKEPYQNLLFDTHFIKNIPYVSGMDDPLWHDCSLIWQTIEESLAEFKDTATALIIEPLVQGAAGMKIYSADFLKRLAKWAKYNDIHLIVDEITTGIGRTGKMLAIGYTEIQADFICLGKGLTAGWIPMSAVIIRDGIYEIFYDDYNKNKSFLHSNTYSGNTLGASIALEVLKLVDCEQSAMLGTSMLMHMERIRNRTGKIKNVRGLGAIVAADLVFDDKQEERPGFKLYQKAISLGALLRPLGNTIYWTPPFNTSNATLFDLANITEDSLR